MIWKGGCFMVSIIVPVYNGREYLDRCVSSVVAQTLRDWELILVDDGSTDGAGALCDQWAARDARIRVIHQKNAGVSAARNVGLDTARGAYIGFVDVDDYIAPETYERALDAMGTGDMVIWDAVTVWPDGRTEPDTIPLLTGDANLTRQDMIPELLCQMAGSVCRCLYRRNLIREIRFPMGIKFSEDRLFNLQAMGRAVEIHYRKWPLYFRWMHDASTVHRYHDDYFEAAKAAHLAVMDVLEKAWGGEDAYVRAYERQFLGAALGAIHNYHYKTSPLTAAQRREKVKALCEDPMLRQILDRAEKLDLRQNLMKYKQVAALCLLAKLANWKHGR
jgi:glycosyltransferase involved in cell wall biosynthesis